MKNYGRVSVIIPVYNVEAYVAEAIESVICQTYSNIEIIIIDDGSTDRSGEICEKYVKLDDRVCLIHQDNKGLSAARNVGLNMMTGDTVAFLDSDDAYYPNYIEAMVTALNREKVDIVICKFALQNTICKKRFEIIKNIKPDIEQGIYCREDALRELANGRINHSVWNKLYRTSLWDNIRFPEGHIYEDANTTFQILNICKSVFVLKDILYMYRIRLGSLTCASTIESFSDWIQACANYNEFIQTNIPSIFTEYQLHQVRQMQLEGLIKRYESFIGNNQTDCYMYCKLLEKNTLALEDDVEVKNCRLIFRLCSWMIKHCPWGLRMIHPIYYYLKKFI